jgi:DNA-directed RNA polymerase specialized sigma54-like protein
MRLSHFLDLPEQEFLKFIYNIEDNPVFKRLAYPGDSAHKIISFRRFPSTEWKPGLIRFNEDICVDNSSVDVDGLLMRDPGIVSVIRNMGIEKFKKYFLYNETTMGIGEISAECGVSGHDCRRIMDLINDVFIRQEFFGQYQDYEPEPELGYLRVADIERERNGLKIRYLLLNSARGRYQINYRKLWNLKESGLLKNREMSEIDSLISKLKMVNARKTLIFRLIQAILKRQKLFFNQRRGQSLNAFSQREAAGALGVTPGIISRVVSGKSIGMPWGEVKPLKEFFMRKKQEKKNMVRGFIEENMNESVEWSDEFIRKKISERHGISLSRRSVCLYRNELFNR